MLLYNANASYIANYIDKVQDSGTDYVIKYPVILDVVEGVVRVLDVDASIVYSFNEYGVFIEQEAYDEGGAWVVTDPPANSTDYHLGMFQGEDIYKRSEVVESSTTIYSSSIPEGTSIAGVVVGVDTLLILTQPVSSPWESTIDRWYLVQADGTTTVGDIASPVSRNEVTFGVYSNNNYSATYATDFGWVTVFVDGYISYCDYEGGLLQQLDGVNSIPLIAGNPRTTLYVADGFVYCYYSSRFVKWKVL